MTRTLVSLALAGVIAMTATPGALANSISDVEEARANERAGRGLTEREVDSLRRYGGNDDGYLYYRGYDDEYYDDGYAYRGSVYIGPPRHGYIEPGYVPYAEPDEFDDDEYDAYGDAYDHRYQY